MKRGGHTPSEPGRAAGRQNLRPYGALTRAVNAVRERRNAPHPPAHAGPSLSPLSRGERLPPSPRLRGEGRRAGLVLAAVVLPLMTFASPVMARVPVILDFGDSLTAGYGLPAGQAFAVRLAAWIQVLGFAVLVCNDVVDGDHPGCCMA